MGNDVELILTAKDAASGEIKKVQISLTLLSETTDKTTTATGELWKGMTAGILVADAIKKAIGFLQDQLESAGKTISEFSKSLAQFNSILSVTGFGTEKLTKAMNNWVEILVKSTPLQRNAIRDMITFGLTTGANSDQIKEYR